MTFRPLVTIYKGLHRGRIPDLACFANQGAKPMKKLIVSASLAAAMLTAGAASAAVTFDSFGGSFGVYGLAPGETLFTDFSGPTIPGTGTGELILGSNTTPSQGREGTYVAAPAFSTTGQITGQYFYLIPGASETFTFKTAMKDVGLYVGSLDATNTITLNLKGGGTETYTGSDLAALGIGAGLNDGAAAILAPNGNGRFTFTHNISDIQSITLSQGTGISTASFEVAQIVTSVPEPATWATMLLGFFGLGAVLRRRRTGLTAAQA
jgi:hypothetical protein